MLLVPMVSFSQFAAKTSIQKVEAVGLSFLKKHPASSKLSISQIEKQTLSNGSSVYLARLKPTGFLIVSLASARPVYAFSFLNDYGVLPHQQTFTQALFRDISIQKPTPASQKQTQVEKTWGPFVQTLWGQVNCYDKNNTLVNVTNYYTPHNYAAGCVAISMSTIFHYYRWPLRGVGSTTYTDSRGSSQGTYSVDYGHTDYDWKDMLNRYKYKSSTLIQRQAVGQLAYHVAVSLHMDFEYNGSTSNVNRIPSAANRHFRFSGLERTPSYSKFWTLLDRNLSHNIPVVFAVKNDKGVGHSIICDGLKIDENGVCYYHLNMGWWGTSNGWYRIRDTWNAGTYNAITDAVFFLLPSPYLETPYVKAGADKVNICWRFPVKIDVEAFEIQQKIDNGNWTTLSNKITDTCYLANVLPSHNQYFRVRAEINDRWPYDGWSNVGLVTQDITGIKDNFSKVNIALSPNPASEMLNIRFDTKTVTSFAVYNSVGQMVISVSRPDTETYDKLNIGFLYKGIYFIRFYDKGSLISIKKFIKQ